MPVSVNISALHLSQPGFVSRLEQQLKAYPLAPHHSLELKRQETAALGDLGQMADIMRACQALQARFALEDFGTGYASMS